MFGGKYDKTDAKLLGLVAATAVTGVVGLLSYIRQRARNQQQLNELLQHLKEREYVAPPQPPVSVRPAGPIEEVPAPEGEPEPRFIPLEIHNINDLNDIIIRDFNNGDADTLGKRYIFLDFTNARGVRRGSYSPQHGYLELTNAYRSAEELVDELIALGKLTREEADQIDVTAAKGSFDMEYVSVLSSPRTVSTGKRKPFKARFLTAIIQRYPTRDNDLVFSKNPITDVMGESIPQDFYTEYDADIMANYGINEAELELMTRILFAEQSTFRYGQCWAKDPLSDGLLCDLQRRAILNALLNRMNEYKENRGIPHLDSRGIQAIITGWVGRRYYATYRSTLDQLDKNSDGYKSNEKFILETAMLPSFTEDGITAVHPWGDWGSDRPRKPYPDFMLHTSDGGNLEEYPIIINYGLYS